MKNITRHTADRMGGENVLERSMLMSTVFCDRCGSRIDGKPLGMHFAYGNDLSLDMRRIEKMDFCEECMAEIVELALHKNVCDECNH